MNKRPLDTTSSAALRDLDPAPVTVLTDEELARADEIFARIVANPHDGHVVVGAARPPRHRLLVSVGLIGAAGAAVPALLLGGGSAFASWTPTPQALTAAGEREAAATCRTTLEVPDQGEQVVVAERRGGWTYVLLAGPASEGFCLMPDDLVGHRDPARERPEGFFGGYTTDPGDAPTLPRDRIDETGSMSGSVPAPGFLPFRDDGWFTSVQGYVGSDVMGVTVRTPIGTDVEASVTNGRFAAWWPSAMPSSENLDVMGAWAYTVTLTDGSTREVKG